MVGEKSTPEQRAEAIAHLKTLADSAKESCTVHERALLDELDARAAEIDTLVVLRNRAEGRVDWAAARIKELEAEQARGKNIDIENHERFQKLSRELTGLHSQPHGHHPACCRAGSSPKSMRWVCVAACAVARVAALEAALRLMVNATEDLIYKPPDVSKSRDRLDVRLDNALTAARQALGETEGK